MPILSPVGRVGTSLWNLLGLSKSTGQAFTGVNGDIQPTVNVSPFLVNEMTEEITIRFASAAVVLGNNQASVLQNNTNEVQYLFACGVRSAGNVPAGVTIEARPALVGNNTTDRAVLPLGTADVAFAGEQLLSGGAFFDSPIPILPGQRIDLFVTTLTGGAPGDILLHMLIGKP